MDLFKSHFLLYQSIEIKCAADVLWGMEKETKKEKERGNFPLSFSSATPSLFPRSTIYFPRFCLNRLIKESESWTSPKVLFYCRGRLFQQHCFCGGFEMMEETFERSIEFDLWCFDLATMEMNYIVI